MSNIEQDRAHDIDHIARVNLFFNFVKAAAATSLLLRKDGSTVRRNGTVRLNFC